MIGIPGFKPHLQVSVIPGEGVLILSEERTCALHGKTFELLAPLIDGARDADQLADALAGRVDRAAIYYVLALLEKNGWLTESAPEIPLNIAAFWHAMGIEPRAAIDALSASKGVLVRAVGEADASPLRCALADLGVNLTEVDGADLEVVVTDDYLRSELGALNTSSLHAARPWLLVKITGHEIWLGPLFLPGKTGCYQCLARRLAQNRPLHQFVTERCDVHKLPFVAATSIPASTGAACQLAAVEVAKFIAGVRAGLEGKVFSLNLQTWTSASHELLRNPTCSACGDDEIVQPPPVELVSRKVNFIEDSGHRARKPEETLEAYQHLVSPITGVVSMLEPLHSSESVLHVYAAGHNHALKMESLDFLKASLRNSSMGKGIGDAQAKASALCEGIERYSAVRNGTEFVVTASFQEMRKRFGLDAIHPNDVMLYSDRQLSEREIWNARKSKFNVVPERLDESVPIDWTPVWSLTNERHKYLPTQLVYYQSKASSDCDAFYSMGCSNGNASGNNLEEAVLQGFCELVERDAVAIWWYNRLRKPEVSVASFQDPYLLDIVTYYQRLGREVWVLDITSDLRIPVFAAASRLREGPEENILIGLGCHLDAHIALQRALAEMNQMIGTAQGDKYSKLAMEDEETVSWLKTATLDNQPYLAPDNGIQQPQQLQDYLMLHSTDLLDDIQLCRHIVEDRGMEVLVLDQTRSDVRMPVVKVIVPGLRHFWARFAPGRLYDVPVQMGWLDRRLPEEELNPIPVFF
jgi:ribosomal protein S12 methylthiotransferase accessory factor